MEIELWKNQILYFKINGKRYKAKVIESKNGILELYIFNTNEVITLHLRTKNVQTNETSSPSDMTSLRSPISGRITKIHVIQHSSVKANTPLITIESMKMENEIRAPFDLFIKSIHIAEGHLVKKDQVLLQIEKLKKEDAEDEAGIATNKKDPKHT